VDLIRKETLNREIIAGSIIVTITLLIITGSSDTAFGVPVFPSGEQTVEFDGHCYAYIDAVTLDYGQAFFDAQTKSVNGIPGHLATYSSGAEEAASTSSAAGGTSQTGWIGFTQDPTYYGDAGQLDDGTFGEAGWGWVTGEPVVYSNWHPGEPNGGGGKDYAHSNVISDGGWNDRAISGFGSLGYFVEFDVSCTDESQEVGIDIKPGSDPNSINVNSKGLLPVAIFGSPDFDVTQIDTETVDFDILDVNGSTLATRCNIEDVDGDGIDDMVCFFKIKDIAHKCIGDFPIGQIQGQLLDGTPFRGLDDVRWVNCKHFDPDV